MLLWGQSCKRYVLVLLLRVLCQSNCKNYGVSQVVKIVSVLLHVYAAVSLYVYWWHFIICFNIFVSLGCKWRFNVNSFVFDILVESVFVKLRLDVYLCHSIFNM